MDSLQLITVSGHSEPLVVDTELAERLGYDRPRKIRDLIKRLAEDQGFGPIQSRPTVGRQLTNGGGEREYTVQEYLLTEEQALEVVTKSETPKAKQLTRIIIRVFQAWRKGQLQPSQPDTALVQKLTETLTALNNRLCEVERAVILNSEVITKAEYNAIKRDIASVANLHQLAGRYKTVKAARAAIAWRLFSVLGWVGTGHRHHRLPRQLVPRAWARLEELKRDAERVLGEVAQSKQQELLRGM